MKPSIFNVVSTAIVITLSIAFFFSEFLIKPSFEYYGIYQSGLLSYGTFFLCSATTLCGYFIMDNGSPNAKRIGSVIIMIMTSCGSYILWPALLGLVMDSVSLIVIHFMSVMTMVAVVIFILKCFNEKTMWELEHDR